MQVQLRDVPGMQDDERLLSFHLCESCMDVGHSRPERGYEVALLRHGTPDALGRMPDGLEPRGGLPAYQARHDYMDFDDRSVVLGDDLVAGQSRLDLETYGNPRWAKSDPGDRYENEGGPKLGGWPSWVQHASWPSCMEGRRMPFVAQIDADFSMGVPWGGGGYAYLFVCPKSCKRPHGELVVDY